MKKIFVFLGLCIGCLPVAVFAAGFDHDLYSGIRQNAEVTRLQEFLRDQGLYAGKVTGNFFGATQSAVKKFQERERVAPARGYFGLRTRARANELLGSSVSAATDGARLVAQIQSLQAQLRTLQDKSAKEFASSSPLLPAPVMEVPAPVFIKAPQAADTGFVSNSPFGAHYPYRVRFDWATDAVGTFRESATCVPALKFGNPSAHATQYFPESHSQYSCTAEVVNEAGKKASAGFSFATPSWVSVAGSSTILFPDIAATPLKIADMTVYNGSTSDILFTSFDVLISDTMDSTPNRNRKVSFLLRNGTTSIDTLISQTDFTFVQSPPSPDQPYRAPLTFPFPITLAAGEERIISVWVEQLQFVKSGTLEIAATKIGTTAGVSVQGLFDFILTKVPSL